MDLWLAIFVQVATAAHWAAGFAMIAAEQDQVGVDFVPIFAVKDFFQVFLDCAGVAALGQSQATADAHNMGVDGYCGHFVVLGQKNAGRFAPYPGKAREFIQIGGDFAAKVADDGLRRADYVGRFTFVKAR